MATYPLEKFRGRSLRQRILWPFFVLLVLLGSAATVGSGIVIVEALSEDADAKLAAISEVVYRELKQQELRIDTYARLIAHSLAANASPPSQTSPSPLEATVFRTLERTDIRHAFFAADGITAVWPERYDQFFDHARRSGRPRFRFFSRPGNPPRLAVATAVEGGGALKGYLLLETPVSRAFLHRLAGPFRVRTAILSREGKLLAASAEGTAAPLLTPGELTQVLSGEKLLKTIKGPLPRRQLFQTVPIGTTDRVILALDMPFTELGAVVEAMTTRSLLTIVAALLVGGYIFYRLINQVLAPIRDLLEATQAVGQGNLDYRIETPAQGELGRLADSFNAMTAQLRDLYRERIEQEKNLTMAQEELKFKTILEQKNAEIEASNHELKVHLSELSTLFQLNQAITSTLDLNLLLDRILKAIQDIIHCDEMVLLIYNSGAEELEVRKVQGMAEDALHGVSFRLDEGITGYAASHMELVHVRNMEDDPRRLNYKGRLPGHGSLLSVPLAVKNRLAGVLNLHKGRPDAFTETEIKLVQTIANQAAIAIENARLYEKTRSLSNTDELTGLANRRHFQDILAREVAQARRFHSNFSVIMADLDHFKAYNDFHGHLRGDVVLRKVAAIMLQNTRGIDLVGRFGGEEFVILLPKTTRKGAAAAADKLRQETEREVFSGAAQSQPEGRITLSLGVAEFPSDSKDIYELLDLADRALYRAKKQGRNRVVAWSAAEMTESSPPEPPSPDSA